MDIRVKKRAIPHTYDLLFLYSSLVIASKQRLSKFMTFWCEMGVWLVLQSLNKATDSSLSSLKRLLFADLTQFPLKRQTKHHIIFTYQIEVLQAVDLTLFFIVVLT